ncbi:hypothetical protein APA_482 [Pseudanabaena sp. lw0831]|uniref:hypothetical protein n=1 Tax=Pseudanabaena sp. lw0831 TaxID=1357935 RepID=UPI0019162171|nr:hypothetical protein [Pseudanabaena sp. lw0831]GBO51518.1 hypothetical protein APA_482 [Pseudanabaena sp. lw0831]
MSDLTFEKQFSHAMFCQQVENIDIDTAKKLLADLHLLYLGQQAMFTMLVKQDGFMERVS